MNAIIAEISNFIFDENEPAPSDLIIVVGGSHPELAEKAAALWKDGYAPLCFAGGGVSIKSGVFPGPRSKAELYNGSYQTESEFFTDVLIKNGVDQSAIIGENKSSFTRENAVFAKQTCDALGIAVNRALIVCKSFHAKRSKMFFQSAFPNVQLLMIPIEAYGVTKENWFQSQYGINRVLGELKRCGDQFTETDIQNFNQL